MVNINDVDIKRIVLSNKTLYGKKGANKYYAGYLSGCFRPLNIAIKDTEQCAINMHVLTNCTHFSNMLRYGIGSCLCLIKLHLKALDTIPNT